MHFDGSEDALGNGGAVKLGGKRHELGGTFFEPTILTGISANMKIARTPK